MVRTRRGCLPAPAPSAASRCAGRCRRICRASAWWSRANASRFAGPDRLPVLPGQAGQAGRGRGRNAGGGPAPVEGGAGGARAVRLPGVRKHRPAAGAVPPDRARPRRPRAAGHDPGSQVRAAPAAQPAKRHLCARGRRDRRLHHGGPGGRVHGDACAAGRADPGARDGGRARPWRRHHRAGAGPRQDGDRPPVGLCARRPAVRRARAARRRVPLFARPPGRAPEQAPGGLRRHPAGRRLRRVQRPLP